MKIIGSILEILGGTILIVIPEPATTTTGAVLAADGVRRLAGRLDKPSP